MSIGEVLKKYREKNNMTQVKLAQLLNVSNKTISKWERGYGYPDITMIHTISSLLKISVNELLSGLTVENSNISSNIVTYSHHFRYRLEVGASRSIQPAL